MIQPPGFTTPGNLHTQVTANVVGTAVELPSNMVVGEHLQKYLNYRLGGTPPEPVDLTVEVTDASIALISDDPQASGAGRIVLNNIDLSRQPAIYVQGMSRGTTSVTVSATGYISSTCQIEIYPSGFSFSSTSPIGLFVSQSRSIAIQVAALSPQNFRDYERQEIRGGLSVPVHITSADPDVGHISGDLIEIPALESSGTGVFEALSAGSTTLSLVQPEGFYLSSNGTQALTVNAATPVISIRGGSIVNDSIYIGKDLQKGGFSYSMDVYPSAPIAITATVTDTSVALISDNRTEAGGKTLSNVVNNPANYSFYLQGLKQGSTTLTVSAPGYLTSIYPIEVFPSGFIIMQPSVDFTTDVFSENTRVTVYSGFYKPDDRDYFDFQEIRAGLAVDVSVISSDEQVGVITKSPLTFQAGQPVTHAYYQETYFDPLFGGSTTISVAQPSGFTRPSGRAQRAATVVASDINIESSLTVGKNLQDALLVKLESIPPVPVDLTVTIVDTNVAVISDSRTSRGSRSITFPGIRDTDRHYIYVQGLKVGNTEVRAQAIGFNDTVSEIAVDPSAMYIAWPYNNFNADAVDPGYQVNVFTAILDRTTLQYNCLFQEASSCWKANNCITIEEQCAHPTLRGGLTVRVPIHSSDTSVGLPADDTLTFVGGEDFRKIVELDIVGSGTMELSITPPDGFSLPANRDTRILGTVRGIGSSPVVEAYVGRAYNYDVQPSHSGQGYVFSLETAPDGMTVDGATGLIRWIPEEARLGNHTVTVLLQEGDDPVDRQNYTLSVLSVDPDNKPPMFYSSPVQNAVVETPYFYQAEAVDIDEGEVLSFTLSTAPAGMSVNAATGLVEWTPAEGQAGEHEVILNVRDAAGAMTTKRYALTVSTLADLDRDYDGFTANDGDCDDTDPSINPDAVDIAGNDIDEDCSGEDALTSIRMDSGIERLRIPLGMCKSIGYAINFDAVGTAAYTLSLNLDILPDNGGISVTPGFPATVETQGTKSMHLGQGFTANSLGTYRVIGTVTVDETGQTATVPVEIEVTAGEFVPVLKPLGSMPDAIPLSQTIDVTFKTILVGIKEEPETIELERVDENNTSTGVLGSLADDGTNGDLSAGDHVYSATFPIEAPIVDGAIRFRAKATFAEVAGTFYTDVYHLGVSRFPTDFHLAHPSSIVADPIGGLPIISNRITMGFVEGTSADDIETVVASVNGSVIGIMHSVGVFSVEIPDTRDGSGVSSALSVLQADPQVEFAESAHIGKVCGVWPNDELYSQQHHLVRVRADEAWVMAQGIGIPIAILDTGIDPDHPDLRNKLRLDRLVWGVDFVLRPGESLFEPRDDHFHGTHIAGIAAAETDNTIGMAGTARNSTIYPIRVGYWSNDLAIVDEDVVIRGIWYAASIGIKVINLSVTCEDSSTALSRVVSFAHAQSSLVVASAGNDNNSSPQFPAACRDVITVGATMPDSVDIDKNVRWQKSPTSGSNHGEWVDIAAPGYNVLSTMPTYTVAAIADLSTICPLEDRFFVGCYYGFSGTSMATPMVSGAAALLWSENPEMDNVDIRRRLLESANPMPGAGLGAGQLDIFEALFNGGFEMGGLRGWEVSSRTGEPEWELSPYAIPAAYSVSRLGPLGTLCIILMNLPAERLIGEWPSSEMTVLNVQVLQ